jgi:hypothetical protein
MMMATSVVAPPRERNTPDNVRIVLRDVPTDGRFQDYWSDRRSIRAPNTPLAALFAHRAIGAALARASRWLCDEVVERTRDIA